MAVIDITPVMTSDTTPEPYEVTYSEVYPGYLAWKVFTKDNSSYSYSWYPANRTGWLCINLGTPKIVTQFRMLAYNYSNVGFPGHFKVLGSLDGGDWVELADINNSTGYVSGQGEEFLLTRYGYYQYYKWEVLSYIGESGAIGQIDLLCDESLIPDIPDEVPLTFHKTLKENLPNAISPVKDEVHFTEEGEIYISDKYGNMIQCNTGEIVKNIVNEVSNPLTTNPLEYGAFKLSREQNADFEYINFDTAVDGNMEILDKKIKLKAGKTYFINAGIYLIMNTDGIIACRLMNVTDNEEITRSGHATITNTGHIAPTSLINVIYTVPDHDVEIAIQPTDISVIANIRDEFTSLSIMESRNNPVNQYGGFETTVLFEGKASGLNSYQLSNKVDQYDFLSVTCASGWGSNIDTFSSDIIINTSNLKYVPYEHIYNVTLNGTQRSMCFYFGKDKSTFIINDYIIGTLEYMAVLKVVGIKGQIPTLLRGGTF